MRKIKELFVSSYKEMKDLRCIVLAAMLGSLSVVLGFMTVMLWDFIKVGFTFLPNQLVYSLFGPFVGLIYGAAIDILTFIVKPMGSFFPGFTLSAMVTGVIYGLFLYQRPMSIKRIAAAKIVRVLLVDLLMNTYWLTLLNGSAFMVILPMRAIKQLIMLPIETLMFFAVIKAIEASGILKIIYGEKARVKLKLKQTK